MGDASFPRLLRQRSTWSERVLWDRLRANRVGAKFRRQQRVCKYVCDFYCHELALAIELDGSYHDRPWVQQRDRLRDAWLRSRGIRVLRIRNEALLRDVPGTLRIITGEIVALRLACRAASEAAAFVLGPR